MKNNSIFAGLDPEILQKRKRGPSPQFAPPMLATLTVNYFSDPDWIYEHKFDGIRCLAIKKNGIVHLMSRNQRIINNEYPEIAQALQKQKADNFIIDGEIIATTKGISDFQLLQSRINLKDLAAIKIKTKAVPIIFCIFDLINAEGYSIQDFPLLIRKKLLKKLLRYTNLLVYTNHIIGDGITYFKKACKSHWEGIIAKKANSTYVNKRSSSWLKFKCIMQQELVIGGYTTPRGSHTDFGALLVGYYDKDTFKYAGKVGTGFTQETLTILGKKMRSIEIKKCPFAGYDESSKGIHWLKPHLVAEFQFAQWTSGGKLRVGRYKGLRTDKKAKDVIKETPQK